MRLAITPTAKSAEMTLLPKKLSFLGVLLGFCGWALCNVTLAQGNNANSKESNSNLVSPEYYSGLEFLSDGQSTSALSPFEVALSKSRIVAEQRGIDSVPSLVMIGECLLEQCDIGMAMERYDAAMQTSILGKRWVTLLRSPPGQIRAETNGRDVQWSPNVRGTHPGSFPEAWPIAIGAPDVLLEMPAGQGVTGRMATIDALEILRCQAIALRRRYQLLGPLAKHSPLSTPLADAFRIPVDGQHDVIRCSINICSALAEIGLGNRNEATQLLKNNLSVSSGMDHPLTAIALLTLADLAMEANEISEAESRCIEASLVSARAGQMDHLAESIGYIAETSVAAGHGATAAKMLSQMVVWATNKSRRAAILGQVEWSRVLALRGDAVGSHEHNVLATSMLLPSQVVMPRAEATLRYARGMTEFGKANLSEGIGSLAEGIAFLRAPSGGSGVPKIFQIQLATQLIRTKSIGDTVAHDVLTEMLNGPTAVGGKTRPLEQLAWLSHDKADATNTLLDVDLRLHKPDHVVSVFDDATRKRYRQANPFESRVQDILQIIHGEGRFAGITDQADVANLRKQAPALDQNAKKLKELLSPLIAAPKWDLRNWNAGDKKRWDEFLQLCQVQTAIAWSTAASPLVVPEVFPPRHSQALLAQSIEQDDALIYFGHHQGQSYGFLFHSNRWQSWPIDEQELQKQSLLNLEELASLLQSKGTDGQLKKGWPISHRAELRNTLFPSRIWSEMREARRWILIPDRYLWSLPFETLPLTDQGNSLPSIAEHNITYVPTLGLVPYLLAQKYDPATTGRIDVHTRDFLSPSEARLSSIQSLLSQYRTSIDGKIGNRSIIDLSNKSYVPVPGRFLKVAASQVHCYFRSNRESLTPFAFTNTSDQLAMQSWNQLPFGSPRSLVLTGVSMMPPAMTGQEDEWLRILLPAIAQGTRQITLTRWPVGGESTVSLLQSFMDNQQDMRLSEAWQRSVLTAWESQYPLADEILFRESKVENPDNAVSGNHPLLWSGYVNVGDSK